MIYRDVLSKTPKVSRDPFVFLVSRVSMLPVEKSFFSYKKCQHLFVAGCLRAYSNE